MKRTIKVLLISLVTFMLQSCEFYDRSPKPIKISTKISPYYPLDSKINDRYIRTRIPTYTVVDSIVIDTVKALSSYTSIEVIRTISGNYLQKGKKYIKFGHIEDNYFDIYSKLIREQDGIYYEATYQASWDSLETIFLKEKLQNGDAWTSNQSKFLVLSIDSIYTLGNVKYKDVIHIKRSYKSVSGNDESYHSYHRYARGFGEIYSYLPYPVSNLYEEVEYKRIK